MCLSMYLNPCREIGYFFCKDCCFRSNEQVSWKVCWGKHKKVEQALSVAKPAHSGKNRKLFIKLSSTSQAMHAL